MTCSTCATAAPDGSRFCPGCGRPLAVSAGVTPAGVTVPSDSGATMLSDAGATMLQDAGATRAVGPAEPLSGYGPGDVIAGRYRIERLLGRGGMGVVYHAFDERLSHPVALKFLPDSLARDPRRLAQFHNEVRLARQISHPHVCRVYDIGDVAGHLFLSMEYIEGQDLAAVLARRGPFPELDAVDLIRQVAAGLGAVHAAGVVHRDLKPANIMLRDTGRAVLMDFGIAAAGDVDESARITEGTPHYMAPEQLDGEAASITSDIHALGLVMHEIFTGRRLFDAKTTRELIDQQRDAPSIAAARLDTIAAPLRDTVLRCLQPAPAARPASAAEAAATLQVVLLDATSRGRRIVQILVQSLPMFALFMAGSLILRANRPWAAAILLVVVVAIFIVELRYPLGWTVTYKGHTIRFWNHAIWGERLMIDGKLMDRGRVARRVTLRGTIERGAGAGERITAEAVCGYTKLSCRIVAEAFAPSGGHATG